MFVMALLGLLAAATAVAQDAPAEDAAGLVGVADEVYTVGEAATYEVVTPKRGVIGGPPSVSGLPDRPATGEEDFQTRYVRVEVVQKRESDRGVRVVLRLDEVTKSGRAVREGVYFLYVDVSQEHAHTIRRVKDDGREYADWGFRYDLPCPISLACPPALWLRRDASVGGYLGPGPFGIAYERKDEARVAESSETEVTATCFRTDKETRSGELVEWPGEAMAKLLQEIDEGAVLFRETQRWDSPEAWLWTEAKRRDAKGNLMMRATRVKMEDDKEASNDTEASAE